MNPKPIIIACICSMLFIAVAYFGGKWVLTAQRVDELPVRKETNKTAQHTKETEAESVSLKEKVAFDKSASTNREYKTIEELLANASPEERRRWAEIVKQGRAAGIERDPSVSALLKESKALRERVRQEIAEQKAELAEEDDFDEWAEEVRQRQESDMQAIEEAKRISETHQAHLDEFKKKLQRWGLWDYETNQPKTTQ